MEVSSFAVGHISFVLKGLLYIAVSTSGIEHCKGCGFCMNGSVVMVLVVFISTPLSKNSTHVSI